MTYPRTLGWLVLGSLTVSLIAVAGWWAFGGLLDGWLFTLYKPAVIVTLYLSGDPHAMNPVIGFIAQVVQTFLMMLLLSALFAIGGRFPVSPSRARARVIGKVIHGAARTAYEQQVTTVMVPPNEFETAVVEKMLAGDRPALAALRLQAGAALVRERQLTGVGFMTTFALPPAAARAPVEPGMLRFGDVQAELEGVQHGAGFLLYVEDGLLHALEGYTYDEPWPTAIASFELKYQAEPRDFVAMGL